MRAVKKCVMTFRCTSDLKQQLFNYQHNMAGSVSDLIRIICADYLAGRLTKKDETTADIDHKNVIATHQNK
jgi:hypothetical protein